MSFDWNYYLVIAKKLKTSTDGKPNNNNNEALRRTAISRAYYAMYHFAVSYAENNLGYQKPAKDYHPHIRSHYKKQMASPNCQEVGKILFQLHKARVDCDYKSDGIGNVESLLTSSILQADKIKSFLR